MAYLVTEVDPDPHAPQRVRDTAEARLVQILERSGTDEAAISVRDAAVAELASLHTLGDYHDRVATERGHSRHAAVVAEHLGPDIYADPAFPTLLGRLRAVELGGHDVQAVFTEAFEQRSMTGAGSQAQVMHWRVGKLVEDRTPDYTAEEVTERTRATVRPAWEELAEQHRDRAAATGNRVETFLATLAGKAGERTEELGAAAAAEPPAWATEWLGPLPDQQADLDAHRQWVVDAGQVAAYREYRGVPDTQISIGEAPAPSQRLAHELWTRAAAVGAGDPRAIDWRQATDAHLRDAIERWEREQQWSPPQVSAELGEALALAHDASNDAVLGRARLDTMAPDDPGRERLEARVRADEVMAEQATGFAASLDAGHTARAAWWEHATPQREAAAGARAELTRPKRHHRPDRRQRTPDRYHEARARAARDPRGAAGPPTRPRAPGTGSERRAGPRY